MYGTILIRISFAFSILSAIFYFYNFYSKKNNLINYSRLFYHISVISIMFSSALMIYFIMTHHFEYHYIWAHSSTDLSPSLLFSTFYAGQEGSFSIWALFTGLLGVFLMQYSQKRNYENELMSIYSLIFSSLILMIVVKNPFEFIWNVFPTDLIKTGIPNSENFIWIDEAKKLWAQIPTEGRGLNPLLQNYWMVIHPPILFLGFTALAIPFAHSVAALMKKDYTFWINVAKPWVIFASLSLGAGIILGGYWAYETLGWGGFWGWDPVENSSFVPWLTSVALIHTMLTQSKSGNFLKTNFALSIISFVLVLYSTFLTRSGVLGDTSVHSFVDPGMLVYWLLVGMIILFILIGFGLLIYRRKEFPAPIVNHSMLSRDFALFLGASTLVLLSFFVALGTSSPIITNLLKGKISAVDISYYNTTALPLSILISLLVALGQSLWWQNSKIEELFKNIKYPLLISLILTIIAFLIGVSEILILLYIFTSLLALFVNIFVTFKIGSKNLKFIGGSVTHIGLALMFIGFLTSSKYDDKKTLSLIQGEKSSLFGFDFTYKGYNQISKNKFAFDIDIENNNSKFVASPTMYFNEQENNLIRNPDILNLFTKDLYISPISLEEPNQTGSEIELIKNVKTKFNDISILYSEFNFETVKGKGNQITLQLKVQKGNISQNLILEMQMEKNNVTFKPAQFENYSFTIKSIPTGQNSDSKPVIITITENKGIKTTNKETLITEISIKPFINLVWIGTFILIIGFVLTIFRRIKESKTDY